MRSIFTRKAKAAFIACAWSSAALAHSFTNHAGHVVSGALASVSNGVAVISGRAYPLTVFPASEQARMRAVLGIPATPAPREKAAARFREEMEKRRAALKSAR